ncbi:hypothetical protein [Maricaulis sp.]|uniref:hypothetical protein n=1 Tax=Maricaulis sp. TaxID=1486257 RepID=UPI00260CB154|nr:hypothetical protein [Maricaulis sp.]
MLRTILPALFFFFSGPALALPEAVEAEEAIRQSIAQPHAPLAPMWVEMNVCGAGADGARGFLNSMPEYRDRGSLNVELVPEVRAQLAVRLGGDPLEFLRGYRVRVFGAVRQVRINLLRDGQPSGRYYFQTQMRLGSAILLEIIQIDGEPAQAECGPLVS